MASNNQNEQLSIIARCEELASEGRIPEAISTLRGYLNSIKDTDRLQQLEAVEGDYMRMVEYFLTGHNDPYRKPLHSKTIASILSMASDCRRDIIVANDNGIFATKARFENLQNLTLSDRLTAYRESIKALATALIDRPEQAENLRKERDMRLTLFFYKLWTVRNLDKKDFKTLNDILISDNEDFALCCQIINALLMRCMDFFDHNVILLLADIAEGSISERISSRALTALILLMTRHRKKLEGNEMIRTRLELWQDNLIIYRRLREVVKALIRTRDTDRISDTMKSEIIPGLRKIQPEIMKRMRDVTSDFEPSMLEENPEWEEMLKRNGLNDRLRELSELQSEGADVMMVAFSNLKNFPFFSELSNWLLPFDIDHSALASLRQLNLTRLEKLFSSQAMMMCDSDKYSMAFSLTAMPEAQRNAALNQLNASLEQLTADHNEKLLKSSTPEFDNEANMYVRDLYRFYRLRNRNAEFTDPLKSVADFTRLPVIGDLLMESDIIDIAAEFFFRHGYYKEALSVFRDIDKQRDPEGSRYEKMGFCHQKIGNHDLALEYYDKAELFSPESNWLLRKRAFCYRQAGDFRTAEKLYRRLLEQNPENLNLICNVADCLAAEGKTSEALREYYKADYLHAGNKKVERAIAWNELRSGHYEKSESYHNRILAGDPEERDFLTAGHTAFMGGKPREALRLYKEAKKRYPSPEDFHKAMEADFETLMELGADPTELRIMSNATF